MSHGTTDHYPSSESIPDIGFMMKANSRVRINGGTVDEGPISQGPDIGYSMALNAMTDDDRGLYNPQLPVTDIGYEMKDLSYNPSNLGGGRALIIPANYGGYGSLIDFNSEPVVLGLNGYTDPRVPLWNNLVPINWNVYVVSPEEQTALAQVGLTQVATTLPVNFQQPPTASVIAYA